MSTRKNSIDDPYQRSSSESSNKSIEDSQIPTKHDTNPCVSKLKQISLRLTPTQLTNHLLHGYVRDNYSKSVPIAIIQDIIRPYGSFIGWMIVSFKEAEKLKIGDKIDHRDFIGQFVFAKIIAKHPNSTVPRAHPSFRSWSAATKQRSSRKNATFRQRPASSKWLSFTS